MMETLQPASLETMPEAGLVVAISQVLQSSDEPLTVAKIRAALPAALHAVPPDALADALERQVAAHVLVRYPKYRSPHERYWDRPMRVHLEHLLHGALGQGPLTWSELRKRLPDYAKSRIESVLEEELVRGKLHRHPPTSSRTGPRYGLTPADPRPYLQPELAALIERFEHMGFSRSQVRAAMLDLLDAEEWSPAEGMNI